MITIPVTATSAMTEATTISAVRPAHSIKDGVDMRLFENEEIRCRLLKAFPKFYINHYFECIIYPPRNSYFLMADVQTETELNAKILEWLSREASKSIDSKSQVYHLNGINTFLGTSFSQEDMIEIYTYLGNRCNHTRTLRFIESGYNLAVLTHEEEVSV